MHKLIIDVTENSKHLGMGDDTVHIRQSMRIIEWICEQLGEPFSKYSFNETYYIAGLECKRMTTLEMVSAALRDQRNVWVKYSHVSPNWEIHRFFEITGKVVDNYKQATTRTIHVHLPDEYLAVQLKLAAPW